jgi:hypothetical protein
LLYADPVDVFNGFVVICANYLLIFRLVILAGALHIACILAASGGPDDDVVFDAPAFTGILVIASDIAVACVIFAVASFHLLASLMWMRPCSC